MSDQINKTYLSVLEYDESKKNVFLGKSYFNNIFNDELKKFDEIFSLDNVDGNTKIYGIEDLYKLKLFFTSSGFLKDIDSVGEYRYCKDILGTYQGFEVNLKNEVLSLNYVIEIVNRMLSENDNIELQEMALRLEEHLMKSYCIDRMNINNDNKEQVANKYIKNIALNYKRKLNMWTTAYSIGEEYKKCQKNTNVVYFSHRIKGWTNPVPQLNPKLSTEVKTNFGFGKSSYFYIKLIYLGIELVPFSDLINYPYDNSHDIVNYTRNYEVEHSSWDAAFEFISNAYSLLNHNEDDFVKKYFISELDNLVSGLKYIMQNNHFESFFENIKNGHPMTDRLTDSDLIVFRASKTTGALKFIDKILECKDIINGSKYISEIERVNSIILPFIKHEKSVLPNKILSINDDISKLLPDLMKSTKENEEYEKKRNLMFPDYKKMLNVKNDNIVNARVNKIDNDFNISYPDYKLFTTERKSLLDEYSELKNKQKHLENNLNKLNEYYLEISGYFS